MYTYRQAIDEIDSGNSVLLDAFYEGELLIDTIGTYELLKKKALDYIKKKRIYKGKYGWYPILSD